MLYAKDEHEVIDQEQAMESSPFALEAKSASSIESTNKDGKKKKTTTKFASFCARDLSSSFTSVHPEKRILHSPQFFLFWISLASQEYTSEYIFKSLYIRIQNKEGWRRELLSADRSFSSKVNLHSCNTDVTSKVPQTTLAF